MDCSISFLQLEGKHLGQAIRIDSKIKGRRLTSIYSCDDLNNSLQLFVKGA